MTLGQAVLIAFGACVITLTVLAIAVIKIPAIWGRISAWTDTRMDEVHARHLRASLEDANTTHDDYIIRSRALELEYQQLVIDEHNKDNV